MNKSTRVLLALPASLMLTAAPVMAQDAPPSDAPPPDIVVTAQKRSESLQHVPISMQAFDTETLEDYHVNGFDDYQKLIPSLSFDSFGPGQAEVYFRGIANGNRLQTGSLPSVGQYLDEQPITTIGETVDVHIYDIARIEALAGPQGTLYGASSEAGTIRIITNKPDPKRFSGGVDLTGAAVAHGGLGGIAEAYVNAPLSDHAALRLVGFVEHDGGYIDNVHEDDEVFPTSGVRRDNAAFVGRDLNFSETHGGRAALAVDLDANWTVTPSVMAQAQRSRGTFGYRPSVGDLKTTRYADEHQQDRWLQAALTIDGKIGDWGLTYAGAYFDRHTSYTSDYSDYAFFYDSYYAETPEYFGDKFFNDAGQLIDPSQRSTNDEKMTKQSHELRLSSPSGNRWSLFAGLFYERQTNDWHNLYVVPGLATSQSVTGLPGVNYANIQFRTDRDYAAFAQGSYELLPKLTLTGGLRAYRYDNDVVGFFGYNANRSPVGEALCIPGTVGTAGNGKPCDNIDASATGSGFRHKLGLSWQPDADRMLYATWSTGFRPGGINRRPTAPAYIAEKLSNYEAGFKTSWLGRRLRVNGAVFWEQLSDAQFAVTSDQNGITDIVNAGRARSRGFEFDAELRPAKGLTLSAAGAYADARITTNLCQYSNPTFDCTIPSQAGNDNSTTAPKGTRFPNSPVFKGNVTARYEVDLGVAKANVQASLFHQSSAAASLDTSEAALLGRQPAYETVDTSGALERDGWTLELAIVNLFDRRGEQLRYASCNIMLCGPSSIQVVPIRPRFTSVRLARRF